MIKDGDELYDFIRNIKEGEIIFSSYFFSKQSDRPYLSKEFVVNTIKNNKILGFQRQKIKEEERYRVGIRLSNRYTLVSIIKIQNKNLYIITAWITSRKWQKAIQK